jgi:RNA polymerase sigma factor (TIGR02999 family)
MIQRELEKIASYLLKRENQPISIVTGDLVNEAIVKLLQSETLQINDRAHVLALAARVMRHVLVDAARRKSAQKREVGLVALTTGLPEDRGMFFEMQSMETALVRLAAIAPERAQIVELRYYAGMSVEEVAEAIGVSSATVKRSWASTRLWLKDAIKNDLAG